MNSNEDKIKPSDETGEEISTKISDKVLLIYMLVIGAIIVGLVSLVLITKYAFVETFWPEPTIMQTATSPDGKHTAYVFESNGGATCRFTYRLSILDSNEKLGKGNGNTFITYYEFDVKWIDNKTLQVNNTSTINTFARNVGKWH